MKNIFKKLLGLIALFTLLFIFSCTEEFDVKNENNHQQNRNFEIKYKSFQQLMKEQKFNSAYKKVDQKIKTIKLASKTVMEEMYNFTIDTTVINEYHTNNYTSYNIGIIRDSLNNNYFENLFVEIDSSNVTTVRILKYNINPISKLISSVETTPIIYNATSVTGKEAPGGEDCQTVSVYLQTQCGCPGHHWPGEGGCNCPNDPSTSTLLYSFTSCSSGGGGDVFDTGTLPSDSGTNILVTTTGGGSGSGSIAVPVVINYEKLRKNNLFKGTFFSLSERTWFFSQSEETQGAIMNYLESTLEDENGLILANVSEYSLEAKTFVKEVINASIEYVNIYGNTSTNNIFIKNFIEDVTKDNNVEPEELIVIPPDCESFNFIPTGSNWQMAAVQNINFIVLVISPQGLSVSHVIDFPQPMLFQSPINLSIGNTIITPGMAAFLSAKALRISMNETVKKYGNKPVTETIVRLYFESRLKHNYLLLIPGGRVTIHPQNYNVIPTQYQTNTFGIGDCN